MQREGIFREMKRRRSYEKPSERRVREKAEAVRRHRKVLRKRMEREGYWSRWILSGGGGMNMSKAHDASAAARRKANEVLTKKQDNERTDARDKQRQAEEAKTAKLKALRLAKEAADKVARDAAPAAKRSAARSR